MFKGIDQYPRRGPPFWELLKTIGHDCAGAKLCEDTAPALTEHPFNRLYGRKAPDRLDAPMGGCGCEDDCKGPTVNVCTVGHPTQWKLESHHLLGRGVTCVEAPNLGREHAAAMHG